VTKTFFTRVAVAALAVAALTACGQSGQSRSGGGSFTIAIDGSSTVFPIAEAVAEGFQQENPSGARVTVGESGTGGGFRKFCRGEIQVANASRPILANEIASCAEQGVQFVEVPIAFDGLTVVVHPSNPVQSITVAQLRSVWRPEAQGQVSNWRNISPSFPDLALSLFGPGTASGTFDYFTEAVVGKAKSSRTDYTPTEDDNVTVQGVSSNPGAMGYFGLAYFEQNRARVRALAIDNGAGPIMPSAETVANGTYQPLSRPVFIYFNAATLQRPQTAQFAEYMVVNAARFAERAGYVPLPPNAYATYATRVAERQTGTAFGGENDVGASIEELLSRELVSAPAAAAPATPAAQ